MRLRDNKLLTDSYFYIDESLHIVLSIRRCARLRTVPQIQAEGPADDIVFTILIAGYARTEAEEPTHGVFSRSAGSGP